MSRYAPAARPLVQCLRAGGGRADAVAVFRSAAPTTPTRALPLPVSSAASSSPSLLRSSFTTSARQWQDVSSSSSQSTPPPNELEGWELDPDRTTLPWAEKELMRRGTPPVGSRRRRAAIQAMEALYAASAAEAESSEGTGVKAPVPFELMPYQCFQEARKVLKADRDEKLRQIAAEAAKIRRLEAVVASAAGDEQSSVYTSRGGAAYVQRRLASLRKHVEELKIMADINDPMVKRRFEDGLGDMNKPIYRHLAEQRWRGRPLRIVRQRIDQFHLAPDLLTPAQLANPRADVELYFRSYKVAPGAIVDSLISEVCPRLRVQVFDRGTRLVSVVVVDADVPDVETDGFTRRCHFLAANIPLAPTDPSVPLSKLDPAEGQLVLPWLPAFAQKGSPPHRLAVFVLEQPRSGADGDSKPIDVAALRQKMAASSSRDGFSVRGFVEKHGLEAVGATLFRTEWDAGTAAVMARAGVPELAGVELRRVRLKSLKPPRKARGWEAKRQGPKYRHLWKYTHRIATPKRKFVR